MKAFFYRSIETDNIEIGVTWLELSDCCELGVVDTLRLHARYVPLWLVQIDVVIAE